jgi:hypothetical protein
MQRLYPFEPQPWLSAVQLRGNAHWQGGTLSVCFALQAPRAALKRPGGCGELYRRDGLWQSTCFEAFLSSPGQEAYWEINLSPNGDWNVYGLSAYRQNLKPAAEIKALPYCLRALEEELQISFQLNLCSLLSPAAPLELCLTAVLDDPEHGCSYWAWRHGGTEPDFHRRASFQLLEPSA